MGNSLFKLKEYGVFTFKSTAHALKAERVLKNASAEFLMMPTPRQISTSCGLAVKVFSDTMPTYHEILLNNRVEVDGAYNIKVVDGETCIERVNNG